MAGFDTASNRWRAVVRFGARRQKRLIGIFIIICAMTSALAGSLTGFSGVWEWIDPALTLGTLSVALLVWFGEISQDWERQLPQQLTVEFHYQGRTVFLCERAPLIDEEPRAWAQQIGLQMNGNEKLSFWPIPEETSVAIEPWRGKWVRHRKLRFELQQPRPKTSPWNHDNDFGRKLAIPPTP
jgi:hypothetical protein